MFKNTWLKEKYYNEIVEAIIELLGDKVSAIIVFGSSVYFGSGKDIDLLIILDLDRDFDIKEKLEIEYRIRSILQRRFRDREFDIHVFDYKSFIENLIPESFLAGLALGYEILLDKHGIEEKIIEFLEKLSKEKRILVNRYSEWDLSHHAKVLVRLKKKRKML
ncbi:MAG: hypothetical protein B6U89_05925 [Desulfurococcales archaeon ex4484_58]|nr:MAG: hypothetical protein B6U89_05925 [Desulfurococcales archaeon ex4484_58]